MDPVELNPLPPREALEYFRSKGYAPALQRFDYRDHWREEHARGFVVAKAMRDDVLSDIRAQLDTALEQGQTLTTFRQELAPRLRALGWWGKSIERDPVTGQLQEVELGSMRRLKVIFDTNMRTSYAAGQWARLQRTKDFLPFLEYRQIQRESARDEHKPYHSMILPIDHPLWQTIFPPNGWFCGCSVRALNQRMMDREGKRVTTDDELAALEVADWTNPRSGETEELLEGIDPSFASNPGFAWQDISDRHAASRLSLPETHIASDRGFATELAALALRDNRNAVLAYDMTRGVDAAPIGMVRGVADARSAASLNAAMADSLLDETAGVVLVRGQSALSTLPVSDVGLLARSRGLAQSVVATPDGSVFRIERGAQVFPANLDVTAIEGLVARTVQQVGAADRFTAEQLDMLTGHGILDYLSRVGVIRYAAAPSGRVSSVLGEGSTVLEEIALALDGWFAGDF